MQFSHSWNDNFFTFLIVLDRKSWIFSLESCQRF
jgi:hypothetical protein